MGAGGQATSNRLDDIVEKLRSSESSGFIPAPRVIPKLATGGRVVILSGVLSGHIGMCGEVRGERVKVSTSLFGGEASSWYSEQDLAAA